MQHILSYAADDSLAGHLRVGAHGLHIMLWANPRPPWRRQPPAPLPPARQDKGTYTQTQLSLPAHEFMCCGFCTNNTELTWAGRDRAGQGSTRQGRAGNT